MPERKRGLMEPDPDRPGLLGILRGESGDLAMVFARVQLAIIVGLFIIALRTFA